MGKLEEALVANLVEGQSSGAVDDSKASSFLPSLDSSLSPSLL